MKRNIVRNGIVALTVCAGLFVAPTGAGEQPAARQVNPDAQAERIKALQNALTESLRENAILKRQVKDLESELDKARQNRGVTILPGPLKVPGTDQVPSDWKPFQFNGVTYYIVPCEQTSAAPSAGATGTLKVAPGIEWQRPRTQAKVQTGSGTVRLKSPPQVDERPAK